MSKADNNRDPNASFSDWMVNEGQTRIFFLLFIIAQAGYFGFSVYILKSDRNLTTFRDLLGWGLLIARAAANVINLNCAMILFTVCRNVVSAFRSTILNRIIPFDKNITFHINIAWAIIFWSLVHTAAHYFNYLKVQTAFKVSAFDLSLKDGPGLTGNLIWVAFFLMCTSAVEGVRRNFFELFWYTHHLFVVAFGLLLMHGSFCFIKADVGDPCRGGPTFWKWWIASGICYFLERLYREYRGRRKTKISKVIQHPCKTVEVQFKKPSFKAKAGQYIFICCPEISPYQWHPFTLTSSPYEDFVSVHIRVVGDWTEKFAQRLGCKFDSNDRSRAPSKLPFVMIDGGYGSASEDWIDYDAALLVGAGIGVTPFASILKTIWYRFRNSKTPLKLKRVYFVWSCRDKDAFSWFQDLLMVLEEENIDHFLQIHTYLTGKLDDSTIRNVYINNGVDGKDAVTNLKAGTHFGRPNWDQIFSQIRSKHKGKDIGVFFCGPKALSSVLHKQCNKWTDSTTDTRFFYGKENF